MSHLAATKNRLSDCKKPRFKRFATNWTKGNKIKKKGRKKESQQQNLVLLLAFFLSP